MPTTPPGFLILDDSLATSGEGDALVLDGDEGRHAAKVARIGVGEQLLLTDAPGRQVLAEVTGALKEALEVRLLADPSPAVQRLPRLTLVQALATGGRDEQAVESATELGVDAVVPWSARRSVSVWRGEKQRKGRARWESTVRAAVKQCRRPGIPAVGEPVTTAQLAAALSERSAQDVLVLVLHEQESVGLMSLSAQLAAASEDGLEEIIVIVGPEGGIAPEELEQLRSAGARSVLLGPEVLRSSTAGPAAIAVLSALVGRWG
ncbi:16S rRNA (uracil(1498)-N(3))-methyltransferase [Brachybacterium massiliense]|uniref:Ribosomal RNA small subunit methyltransferase E n=1 Tax=Brachybacterium massiliense TaxID=1755098 RepID=A0A921MW09_9MICO|nr:16S rRNA (uracil(1498)-N(3))-methyltransferase [Brachybacterium massiliense]HJG91563.1 16S rRNA (uracil(1498)-N(3))-methyltransferase [Brachybacterium massiliense]